MAVRLHDGTIRQLRDANVIINTPGVSETIVRPFIMRQQGLKRDREFAGLGSNHPRWR